MNLFNGYGFDSRVDYVAPGVLRTKTNCSIIDEQLVGVLRTYHYKAERNLSRCCIHKSNDSLLMIMLIIVTNKYIYPPHKHSWKDETYNILCGQCEYIEYNDEGDLKLNRRLSEGHIYVNESRTFHALVPCTDELIFVEHTIGPFTERPLQYLKNKSSQ